MSKKTIILTKKDATEVVDTIMSKVDVDVNVDLDYFEEVFEDKWGNSGVLDNLKGKLEYYISILDITDTIRYGLEEDLKDLVGKEVEVDEEEKILA